MADIIKIPYLNPLQFRPYPSGKFACNLIPEHEEKRAYYQKFQDGDTLKIQVLFLHDGYGWATYRVVDYDGNTAYQSYGIDDFGLLNGYVVWGNDPKDPILDQIDYGIYCIEISVEITSELTAKYRSEYFDYQAVHDNTVMIEYSHNGNETDLVCIYGEFLDRQRYFQLRVEGGVPSDGFSPASKDTYYIDQPRNVVLLNSIPFNVFKFTFGDAAGMPNWVADKLNRIFGLSFIEIGGKQYVKNDGAKLEATREKGYPFAAWQIEMVEIITPLSLTSGEANPVGDYNDDYNEDYL